MQSFDEAEFKSRVSSAMKQVRTILDNSKRPTLPSDVSHTYDDKYLLAEYLGNSGIAAVFNAFEAIGMNEKIVKKLREWAGHRSVTLRFKAEETCEFIKEATREEEDPVTHQTSYSIGITVKNKVVRKITEYFWNFSVKYSLFAYRGNDLDSIQLLTERSGQLELKTLTKSTPHPSSRVRDSIDLNVTWLLNHFGDDGQMKFRIDRDVPSCRTPRRNDEVDAAIRQFSEVFQFASSVHGYFRVSLFPIHVDSGLDLSALTTNELFNPVIALFEGEPSAQSAKSPRKKSPRSPRKSKEDKDESSEKSDKVEKSKSKSSAPKLDVVRLSSSSSITDGSGVVPVSYLNSFLAEQTRAIEEKFSSLSKTFKSDDKVIGRNDAKICVIALHLREICQQVYWGFDYIEEMMRTQLVAAIGKTVGPSDFTQYMIFHNRKMFYKHYQPRAFSYAVRCPDHSPEGVVSIEADQNDGRPTEPIQTIVSSSAATRPMKFALDAASTVSFFGERYVHGYVAHKFYSQVPEALSLIARARQFSAFILMVGRIVSADTFEPKTAIIIRNKDDLKIPLMLETIPTPKEFKDAIESLSPEQQRFAKAFRAMQLSSTLFGVCVIQIKPQLEKLLKLPRDSLTKEIELTEKLLNLFMAFQIPADLLSYDGPESDSSGFGASTAEKVDQVRSYVQAMDAMIQKEKDKELAEERQKAQMRIAQLPIPPPMPMPIPSPMAIPPPMPSYSSSAVTTCSAPVMGGAPVMRSAMLSAAPRMMAQPAPPPPPSGGPAPPPPAASAPPPAAAPPVVAKPASKAPKPDTPQGKPEEDPAEAPEDGAVVDYTALPTLLDKRYEEFDEDSALRPTIINFGKEWKKTYFQSLLAKQSETTLRKAELRSEKGKAFDLLDALTRSGALPVHDAALHVVLAATHCFDKTLIDCVIQNNINPIEKVERSSLIVASTVHGVPPAALVTPANVERLTELNPKLLGDGLAAAPAGYEGRRQ